MTTKIRGAAALRLATLGLLAVGCATSGATPAEISQRELEARNRELASLRSEVEQREAKIQNLSRQLEELPKVSSPPPSGGDLLPPAAKPGQCFARVFLPPSYTTSTEKVLARQASSKIEVIPARYETTTQRVLVKEASFRLEEVPAVYGYEEEKVLVKPARTVWKKGRGPIEKVDHATGEIMCLVEEPAEYKTVRRRVLKQEATTRRVEIPEAYETVKVRKLVEPARERRVEIPAQYQTVTRRVPATEGQLDWRPVLCETNITPGTVTAMQRALRDAGHSPGPIDGQVGRQTLTAVRSYQQKKGLATGGITLATLDSLGVRAR